MSWNADTCLNCVLNCEKRYIYLNSFFVQIFNSREWSEVKKLPQCPEQLKPLPKAVARKNSNEKQATENKNIDTEK